MAADLVQDSKIPQTIVHDLESFFWVLVWIVLTQVEISWTDRFRSGIIRQTMNPKVYYGSGGVDKKMFLTSPLLINDNLQIDGNPTLCKFLEALRILVSARYAIRPTMTPDTLFDPIQYDFSDLGKKKNEENKQMAKTIYDSQVDLYERRLGQLEDHRIHSTMKSTFEASLDYPWPDNDQAIPQVILQSQSVVSISLASSKRSRSNVGDFNKPPSSKRQA
jgi:hypothetical protein